MFKKTRVHVVLCIFVLGAKFSEIWTLSLGWRMSAQGWRMSAQGWIQVSYQLKTGTIPFFSNNKKQNKNRD
jgi:hypothetical protein